MNLRQLGIGRERLFRRWLPSTEEVRFVAPSLDEVSAPAAGGGAEAATVTADRSLFREAARRPRTRFQPLPAPTGAAPYVLNLESVLSHNDIQQIVSSGKLVLHAVGDTGGINRDTFQHRVVKCMLSDFHRRDSADVPAFFFHLGDVVYFKGEADHYFPQFYDAYEMYPAPIFACAGNHDGEASPGVASLDAFVRNFCAVAPGASPDALDVARDTMTQPNVYFALHTPLATIVALYSNVPEGGEIQADQLAWFTETLQRAPQDRCLIVAVHHPLFSADDHHSGSPAMLNVFRQAMRDSGRVPDLILTGHVHNYQRFTWNVDGRQLPVIVAGAGGYPNLHEVVAPGGRRLHLPFQPANSEASLEAYADDRHGFLRLEITPNRITGKYYGVPANDWARDGERLDRFHLDLVSHQLLT